MDYDFRSDAAAPYPRVGSVAPQPDRDVSNLHPSSPAPPLSSSAPQMPEVSQSKFQFDVGFERQILAEAEKVSQNWCRITLENQPSKSASASSSSSSMGLDLKLFHLLY